MDCEGTLRVAIPNTEAQPRCRKEVAWLLRVVENLGIPYNAARFRRGGDRYE